MKISSPQRGGGNVRGLLERDKEIESLRSQLAEKDAKLERLVDALETIAELDAEAGISQHRDLDDMSRIAKEALTTSESKGEKP